MFLFFKGLLEGLKLTIELHSLYFYLRYFDNFFQSDYSNIFVNSCVPPFYWAKNFLKYNSLKVTLQGFMIFFTKYNLCI